MKCYYIIVILFAWFDTLTIYKKTMKRKFQIEASQPFYGSIFRQIEIEGWH